VNWLDFVLGSAVGGSVIAGFMRGFTRTIVGFATSVLAILLSIWFYGAAGAFFKEFVSHPQIANVLGFAAVFFGVSMVGALTGKILARMLKWAGLGWLDRILGAGVGVVRGGVVCAAIVLGLCAFARNPPPQAVAQSQFAPYVLEVANVLAQLAPKELKDGFAQSYDKVKKLWQDMIRKVPAPSSV
jgi:membrane protein required for colicin V production